MSRLALYDHIAPPFYRSPSDPPSGPRLCNAAAFATTEIAAVMSELVRAFRFAPAGPEPEVSLKVATHSLNGLRVIAERIDQAKRSATAAAMRL